MWGASEEPPGTVEGEPSESVTHAKEKCEQNKSQLESLKEVMLKNKQSLKQKEEEVQEYARRLSKIKSRAKLSRRSKEGNSSPKDTTQSPKTDAALTGTLEETIDDISQAKTPKAKSTLLQKKLAENRKVFEQRNKELTETKRAVEEKVEAIRQQLEEKDSTIMGIQKDQSSVTPIMPIVVTSDIMSPIQIEDIQEKENKIKELTNKIFDLEATVLDLQENLKEKDSVIESKTLAVTLMSADLSKKGKTTLDTLEDTKDEMRTMQEHFVLLETSLKNKNDSLLNQLEERDNKVTELEETIQQLEQQMDEQKRSESASIDFSRSTMDTLAETKDAMKSMQENFVLIESSLKAKNDHLLQQLSDYELKNAEANERIFQLESGIGIVKDPKVDDLLFKLEKLEHSNKRLQDEKYELQKSIADMQDRIVNASVHGNGAIMEKDNRIAELENLVEELKQSNKLLEEESKTELQKQLADVTIENQQFSNKIHDLEKLVHQLEAEKSDIAAKLSNESATVRDDDKVAKLTKELEDSNKTMIKMKAQHRSKIKNLQKQLKNFKMVSDTNAELVRLGNQVALLEEEKGNLQLSLVDFDELKASAGDWQERIADLETKVSAQTKEIEMHIEAITTLENQKLDLTQELHTVKQEISALEAVNAESENLRVTAEMKVVDLEEQLEATHKTQESSPETNCTELLKRIEVLTQENSDLCNKITKMKEKGAFDTGSTESFEAIQDSDKSDLLKKVEDLTQKNNELTHKLSKFEEKGDSHAGSTESFESTNDTDRHELLKKIDQLTQENSDLTTKLSRMEEKGSSDAGSTESFERIPEHTENSTKLELLTQEHNELVIKLTKLQEYIKYIESTRIDPSSLDPDTKIQSAILLEDGNDQSLELTKFKAQAMDLTEENNRLQKRIDDLTVENNDMINTRVQLEDRILQLEAEANVTSDRLKREADIKDEFADSMEEENLKSKVEKLLEENNRVLTQVSQLEEYNERLKENLNEVTREKEELHLKIEQMMSDNSAKERLELIDKLERLNQEKESVAHERQELHDEISSLLHRSNDELSESRKSDESTSQHVESKIVADLEREIDDCKKIIAEQTSFIDEMKIKFANKEKELEEKGKLIAEYEASGKKAESLEDELKEMMQTIEDMGHKCNEMQEKMEALEAGKASIEEGFKMLQRENEILLEERKEKDTAADLLKQQLETTISSLELKLEERYTEVSAKDEEIVNLQDIIRNKDHELNAKYVQLQNEMIAIDSLQDELNNSRSQIQEKDNALTAVRDEIANLNNAIKNKEEEIYALRKDITELNDKLQESKPIEVYNELVSKLMDKEKALNEIESKMNITIEENHDLLQKVENVTQSYERVQSELSEKEQKLTDLTATNEHLESNVWELQNIMDNNAKFVDDLQTELKNAYKQTELLKLKHTEDIEMQNQRLENLLGDLNTRNQEFEELKNELKEKERLLEEKEGLLEEKEKQLQQSVTEEVKVTLENKIVDLEQQLLDSEAKIQAQLEKMKKIAATLKKKTTLCQELETRVIELEEKWTTEKDEKETKNKRIQEVEIAMREKDNKIADLEDKLIEARNETAEALKNMDNLKNDLSNSKEEMVSLTQQIRAMEEKIVNLQADIESLTSRLTAEKEAKENISAEYETYKQEVIRDNERKQLELEEVKERARELSVRMQVMETEYVEQLALIKNLQAENGLLLSKQTQINEKLENAEREAEERRLFVEQLQKGIASTTTATTQTSEEDFTEEDTKATTSQCCEQCERYQLLIQALEQSVQEQKAEIENLDKELGNSIGNVMLRFNNYTDQPVPRNSDLGESYTNFLLENNTLLAIHEELKTKLSDALKENKDLADKIEELLSANITLEEKISLTNQTLEEMTEKIEKLERLDSQNVELSRKCEDKETELLHMQKEVQDAQNRADQLQQELKSQLILFENEKQQLVEKEKLLMNAKDGLEQEVESLKVAQNSSQKRIEDLESELELHRKQSTEPVKESMIVKRETSIFDRPPEEQDNAPQLFDASKIFGTSFPPESDILGNKEVNRLQHLLDEKEAQCSNLTQEIEQMQTLMVAERSQMLQNYNHCTEELKVSQENLCKTRSDIELLQHHLAEKDRENAHLNNVSMQMIAQQDQQNIMANELKNEISIKDGQIQELIAELNSTRETLDRAVAERDQQYQLLDTYKLQISNLEAELKNSTDPELIRELERHISNTTKERDLLQLQVNDLTRSMEELKDSVEVGRSLQADIEKVLRERDEAKELVANLTQALEEHHKNFADKGQTTVGAPVDESVALTESDLSSKQTEQEENVEKATHLEMGSTWDAGSSEKLNVDEESWGWNPDDAVSDQHVPVSLVPSTEIQLRVKIDDLEDRIKDLEAEKLKIMEENKNAQVRSGKMIKKLKEYKVQLDNLQQQIKLQKSASDFYQLDSAIEEELKTQINKLEKTLSDVREEQKNTVAEKEALTNRLDVVVSANERYMELKERQDMEMEVLRIRNKELSEKIEALDKRLQESAINLMGHDSSQVDTRENVDIENVTKLTQNQLQQTSSAEDEDLEALSKKYKDEIEDLKKELEAFDAENKELRDMLEKQNAEIHELNSTVSELKGMLTESDEKYSQYVVKTSELMAEIQMKVDYEKEEALCEIKRLELEINNLRDQTEASGSKIIELQNNLQVVLQEKIELEEKMADTMAASDKEISSLKESLVEVTDLLNARIQEVQSMKNKLSYMNDNDENSKAIRDQANSQLVDEMYEIRKEYDRLWESINDKERASYQQSKLESLIPLVNPDNQELVRALINEITEKESIIRNDLKIMSDMRTTLDDNSKEMKKYIDKIAALEQELKINDSHDQAEASGAKMIELQNNLQVVLQEKAELEEKLAEKTAASDKEISSLKESLVEVTDLLNARIQEVQSMKDKLSYTDTPVKATQSEWPFVKEEIFVKQFEVPQHEKNLGHVGSDSQKNFEHFGDLSKHFKGSETGLISIDEHKASMKSLQQELEFVKDDLIAKASSLNDCVKECEEYKKKLEQREQELEKVYTKLEEIDNSNQELEEEIHYLRSTSQTKCQMLDKTKGNVTFNTSLLESAKETLIKKYKELNELRVMNNQPPDSDTIDDFPFLKIINDCQALQSTIDSMQSELDDKKDEVEHFKFLLKGSTYPAIIEDMQGRINCLHNEKAELESFLEASEKKYMEKVQQLSSLEERIAEEDRALLLKEGIVQVDNREEIVRLQKELHKKESEVEDLKESLQDRDFLMMFDGRTLINNLSFKLSEKTQEVVQLHATIRLMENEIYRLQDLVKPSQFVTEAMQKLAIVEQEAAKKEEFLNERLREKEMEIVEIKQRLSNENRKILHELQLRDKDIENLKQQLESSSIMAQGITSKLRQKEEELLQMNTNLAEKSRRLAESERMLIENERISAENERILAENRRILAENERMVAELGVKDADLHNLMVQIRDKDARIEELMRLSKEEEQQLTELRTTLEARETEINALKKLLEEKLKEYELMQNALKRDVPVVDTSASSSSEVSGNEGRESVSQELDLALYMLHQRDVRCEELTHELMQLLEERDTLQLRLSNAIRINEELRRAAGSDVTPSPTKDDPSTSETQEPLVEHPSPSKSEGPVEIAKEAIDAPIGEDKDALAVKLSQLHTVSHAKDVRLRDERELRHTQQMSLLSHKDVLSTLPPEAAARLVNANYTLSRDVQSQSSVLLNWLWGKSTPKVVHM